MCVYSACGDMFYDRWKDIEPWKAPKPISPWPPLSPLTTEPSPKRILTKEEIEMLEKLLEKAKEFDKIEGMEDCEMEEKKEKIRKLCRDWNLPEPNFP